eukprot:TRINITY_DN531_c1_g1_i1.p1 TRINITY_DN531_c1_g1~~TRINITY_DN531_c1_g1_i1.p1  ORF type:complete len:495 (+),score=51.17 TRINITY_DN531_c1_g1_i1:175-1659(+)
MIVMILWSIGNALGFPCLPNLKQLIACHVFSGVPGGILFMVFSQACIYGQLGIALPMILFTNLGAPPGAYLLTFFKQRQLMIVLAIVLLIIVISQVTAAYVVQQIQKNKRKYKIGVENQESNNDSNSSNDDINCGSSNVDINCINRGGINNGQGYNAINLQEQISEANVDDSSNNVYDEDTRINNEQKIQQSKQTKNIDDSSSSLMHLQDTGKSSQYIQKIEDNIDTYNIDIVYNNNSNKHRINVLSNAGENNGLITYEFNNNSNNINVGIKNKQNLLQKSKNLIKNTSHTTQKLFKIFWYILRSNTKYQTDTTNKRVLLFFEFKQKNHQQNDLQITEIEEPLIQQSNPPKTPPFSDYLQITATKGYLWGLKYIIFFPILAGFMYAMVGLPGPAYMIMQQIIGMTKEETIATFATSSSFNFTIFDYVVSGQFRVQDFSLYVFYTLGFMGGLYVGQRGNRKISEKWFQRSLKIVIFVAGIFLLCQGLQIIPSSTG